jgi:cell division protein FtsB
VADRNGAFGPLFFGVKRLSARSGLVDNPAMRVATLILLALLAVVQAELWFGKGSVPRAMSLRHDLQVQQKANADAQSRNDQLQAEVRDLQEGLEMVEEKARTELGMVKPDEVYVQLTTRLPHMSPPPEPASTP